MNTSNIKKAIVTTSAAAICLTGPSTVPAHATTTDTTGGGRSTATHRTLDVDEVVALRKAQMARDFVVYAADRAELARRARLAAIEAEYRSFLLSRTTAAKG